MRLTIAIMLVKITEDVKERSRIRIFTNGRR